jgi:hypothetical protein
MLTVVISFATGALGFWLVRLGHPDEAVLVVSIIAFIAGLCSGHSIASQSSSLAGGSKAEPR